MSVKISTDKDKKQYFAEWSKNYNIHELTCRPISKEGKRISPEKLSG